MSANDYTNLAKLTEEQLVEVAETVSERSNVSSADDALEVLEQFIKYAGYKINPPARMWWVIRVTGYGTFEYFGSEEEAEDMRAHKSEWEGGKGTKRLAKPDEIQQAREEAIDSFREGVTDELTVAAYEDAATALKRTK